MSAQAVELQTYKANYENRQKTSKRFYKMNKKNINTIREELADDFYVLAQASSDEIRKLLEEFDNDQLQFALELEAYKNERVQSTQDVRTAEQR